MKEPLFADHWTKTNISRRNTIRVSGRRVEKVEIGLASADFALNVSLEATAYKVDFSRENNEKKRFSWLKFEMAALALSYNFFEIVSYISFIKKYIII